MQFIQARNFTKGPRRGPVRFIVIHSMESHETTKTAENVASWFAGPSAPKASAHYCLSPEVRVLCADLTWRPIGDIDEGCQVVATEEVSPGMSGRTLRQSVVTRAKRRDAECLRISFSDGREVVCSLDHRWLVKPPHGGGPWNWRAAEELADGWHLLAPFRPWDSRTDRDVGYLEGIYDGEGCWSSNNDLSFSQKHGPVLDRARGILRAAGISHRTADSRENGVVVTDLSGLQATLQALGQFRPGRLIKDQRWIGRALKSRTYSNYVTISSIERVGIREVVSIETGLHTFIAEGIVSHNCVDSDSIVQCVAEDDIAWHAPGVNADGIGIELAGRAAQSREDWLDDYGVKMLGLAADLIADICSRYDIPAEYVGAEGLRTKTPGLVGHVDATVAFGKVGGHVDPGPHFPWDYLLERVRAQLAQPGTIVRPQVPLGRPALDE